MKSKFIHFLSRLLVLTLILAVIAVALDKILPENTLPAVLPYLFALFFLVSATVHFVLLRITRLNPSRFVSYFMLTTFIKLIVYFIAVLIYVFLNKQGILSFILSFFILYIVYTIFEVVLILSQTRDEKSS